jgi:esterase/lipase superfamily enzyme
MELLIHGHAGARMVVFPTSQGRFYEYEDRGMVANVGDLLDQGNLQLFCVDSVDAESFYNYRAHPGWRIHRHLQYEAYLLNEVLPLTQRVNHNPSLMVHGCSFGAYHALNLALRHPHRFGRVLALSGKYDMSSFFGNYYSEDLYFNTPRHFIPNLHDPHQLAALRRMDIVLAIGRDDPNIEDNRSLSRDLWAKGVGHALREWDGWSHDWPDWARMVRHYIGGSD